MEGISALNGQKGESHWPPVPTYFNSKDVGPNLSAFQRPTGIEGDIFNLEIEGEIPKEIAGTFYRIMPDPKFPPYVKDDVWINGDGVVSAFRIKDGHVDFKQRYVETEKLKEEKKARRALMGAYRNKFTDIVNFRVRTVANTTVLPYRNKILALKEDGPPYAMNTETLHTYGVYDFEGQWESETFTAHPKYDAATRELLCFGYEAKGLGTKDILYGSFNKHGKMTEKVWIEAPVCGFQHEMAITENYVIFPIIPMRFDMERVKAGGPHWNWTHREPYYLGILPRREAKSSDIKWFYGGNYYNGHVANSWEEDGKIKLVMTQAKGNVFAMNLPGNKDYNPKAPPVVAQLGKWTIDPKSDDLKLVEPEVFVKEDNEFIRIDDRFMGYKTRYVYGCYHEDNSSDWGFIRSRLGGGFPPFNCIYKFDFETKKTQLYKNGPHRLFQEPVFIPRKVGAPEGDGWLIVLTLNYEEMLSELVILDARDITKHLAICRLPFRLRMGIHGNWIDDTDIDGHAAPPAF